MTHHAMDNMMTQIQQKAETIKQTAETTGVSADSPATTKTLEQELQKSILSEFMNPHMLLNYGISLLMGYLFAVIAISWHRLILLGEDHYRPMKVFAPQKHEIEFLIALAIISAVIPFTLQIFALSQFSMNSGLVMLLFPISILLIYAYFKISFYFPAKAVNASIDLKTSFYLTKGYFWKMFGAYIFSSWRVSLAMFGVIMGLSFAIIPVAILSSTGESGSPSLMIMIQSLVYLPVILYFQPLLTVLGVSILSNYYQHALQNKQPPQVKQQQNTADMNKTRQALDKESEL
jgi:hypothetical protein